MTSKLKRFRQTTRSVIANAHVNLAADIIINALTVATGRAAGNYRDRYLATQFLRSEKCHRWAALVGVDLEWALGHEDSLISLAEVERRIEIDFT